MTRPHTNLPIPLEIAIPGRLITSIATARTGNEPTRLLIGGLGGVYTTLLTENVLNGSQPATWSEFGGGLPNAKVRDMEYDLRSGTLVVGTFGRGVWSAPVAADPEPSLRAFLRQAGFADITEITSSPSNPAGQGRFDPGRYEVELLAEFTDSHDTNAIGHYRSGADDFNLVFDGPAGNFGTTDPAQVASFSRNLPFGLALQLADTTKLFTETDRNPNGEQRVKVFEDRTRPNSYLIGFEDFEPSGRDQDWQDVVLRLTRVSPDPPEPLTTGCESESAVMAVFFGDVKFSDETDKLTSNGTTERTFDLPKTLLPGSYIVTWVSYDGYWGRQLDTAQPDETWFVDFLNPNVGGVVATVGPTQDIFDGLQAVTESSAPFELETTVEATKVGVRHGAPGASSPNSVHPVCIAIGEN